MYYKEPEKLTPILFYNCKTALQNSYVYQQNQGFYTTYTYEENTVIYRASATQNGLYCYTYCLNNPLKYTDPNGEFIPLIVLGAFAIGALIEYYDQGLQNEQKGLEGKEAWLYNIDFFDVAISGVSAGTIAIPGLGFGTQLIIAGITPWVKNGFDIEIDKNWAGNYRWDIDYLGESSEYEDNLDKELSFYLPNSIAQSATAVASTILLHSIQEPYTKQLKNNKYLELYNGLGSVAVNESTNIPFHPRFYKGEFKLDQRHNELQLKWNLDHGIDPNFNINRALPTPH